MRKNKVLIILFAVSVLLSAYTLSFPWIRIHPALSTAVNWGNSANDIVNDSLSVLSEYLEEGFGDPDHNGTANSLSGFREALADEKELVDIISGGECNAYDYGRAMVIVGRYQQDQNAMLLYLVQGYAFFAVLVLAVIAFAGIILERFSWAGLYAASFIAYLVSARHTVKALNERSGILLMQTTDSWMLSAGAAGLVFLLFLVSLLLPAMRRASWQAAYKRGLASFYEEDPGPESRDESREDGGPSYGIKQKKAPFPARVFLLVLVVAALGGTAAAAMTVLGRPGTVSLDLADYLETEISGFEGYGKAACTFASEAFLTDLTDLLGRRSREIEKEDLAEEEAEAYASQILQDLDISPEKGDHLHNGDRVKLLVSLGDAAKEILDRYRIRLDLSKVSKDIPVKDLQEISAYDPFSDLTYSFEGAEPLGEAYISYHGDYSGALTAGADPSQGLSNGDQVTISFMTDYDPEELKEQFGIELTRTRETVEVSGLLSYPSAMEELPDQAISQAMEEAREIAVSCIKAEYLDDEELAGIKSLGQCLAVSNADDAPFRNRLFCLFQADYTSSWGGSRSYIYFVEFTDVMTDPAAGTVLLDTETSLVPKKPDIMPETLNLNAETD